MKNKLFLILPIVTALFVGLTVGLFLGRNGQSGTVSVSVPQPIPAETTAATTPASSETTQAVQFPININTAGKEALTELPGIGEVLAGRIIAYREENGPFQAIEEITKVEGIGEGKAEAILDLISTGG